MKLIENIALTVTLSVFVVLLGLYSYCVYSPYSYTCSGTAYSLASLVTVIAVLGSFALAQYEKTYQKYFKVRKRPSPLMFFDSATVSFSSVFETIWNTPSQSGKLKDLSASVWSIQLDTGTVIYVNERDFFYWLLDTIKLQQDLKKMNELRIRSPLSFNSHVKLGRTVWKIYRMLLQEVNAVKQLNGNVVILKDWVIHNPYAVVTEIEKRREPIVS